MNQTSNYGLYVTDDSTTKFKEWREKMASEANSNMTKIDTALSEKAERSRTIEITLLASGWTGEAVPYLQTITVEGLTADANGSISIASGATSEQRVSVRNAMISIASQSENTLILNCDGKKPTVDIPAVVTILG